MASLDNFPWLCPVCYRKYPYWMDRLRIVHVARRHPEKFEKECKKICTWEKYEQISDW